MREIKFRAWHKELEDMTFSESEKHFWYKLKEYPNMYVLMQFTGLKDKNGKEIFEGDIVKIIQHQQDGKKYAEATNTIGWDNKNAKFDFKETMNGLSGIGGHNLEVFLYRTGNKPGLMDYYLEWEVIGNIYDNPELLK